MVIAAVRREIDSRLAAEHARVKAADAGNITPTSKARLDALQAELIASVRGFVERSMRPQAARIEKLEADIAELKGR